MIKDQAQQPVPKSLSQFSKQELVSMIVEQAGALCQLHKMLDGLR
jgi:hypothetical protein